MFRIKTNWAYWGMFYADATQEQISSFQNNGFLVVKNIVNPLDLIIAEERIKHIANNPNDFSA